MALATGLLGFVKDPAAAWALALARWLFMMSFGVSLATFIQTRWRGDLMAIFTTDGFTAEVGRLAGAFLVYPVVSLSVEGAFAAAAVVMTAAALVLTPYFKLEVGKDN
jgi:uncharacterized protein with von Willebrand factor type A (vWA) domain